MQLLNPQIEQVELEQLPLKRSENLSTFEKNSAIDIEIIGVAATSPPTSIRFSIHSCENVSSSGKLASQTAENFFQFSKNPKLHLDLAENLPNRTLILLITDPYSHWIISSVPISLKSLKKSSHVTLDLKSVRNEEFQLGKSVDGIRVKITHAENSYRSQTSSLPLNMGTLTSTLNHSSPATDLSTVRSWVNTDPSLRGKLEKLQQKQIIQISDVSLAEKTRLERKRHLETLSSRDLALTRQSVIHSTLVNAATDRVLGKVLEFFSVIVQLLALPRSLRTQIFDF